jgi:hypothetical protein
MFLISRMVEFIARGSVVKDDSLAMGGGRFWSDRLPRKAPAALRRGRHSQRGYYRPEK